MRKKIIAITAATLLLATACGCESQQEPDSTTAKTPDASAQQAKPQQQTTEKTAQSFVDEFNANPSYRASRNALTARSRSCGVSSPSSFLTLSAIRATLPVLIPLL